MIEHIVAILLVDDDLAVHASGMHWILLNQPPTWQVESVTGAS